MKQIRRNVFETNSSSSHSISLYTKIPSECDYTQLVPDWNGTIWCNFEEFDWGYFGDYPTNSAIIKLDYLVTQIAMSLYHDYTNDEDYNVAEEVENSEDFNMLQEDILTTLNEHGVIAERIKINPTSSGFVDHQSICLIRDILPDSCGTFSDFIFNPAYNLEIHSDCDSWENTENCISIKEIYQW